MLFCNLLFSINVSLDLSIQMSECIRCVCEHANELICHKCYSVINKMNVIILFHSIFIQSGIFL